MAILTSDQVKMTSLLEKTVAIIAPHRCISCGNYNNIMCTACLRHLPRLEVPCCVGCGAPTVQWRPCHTCAPFTVLDATWVYSYYDGLLVELIHRFKFDHVRAAYRPLAQLLTAPLPPLPGVTVVPVPTIAPHIRKRSYDHAALLAKHAAQLLQAPFVRALERTRNRRQIGSSRAERQEVATSIGLRKAVPGTVLLIDDVCTTGATLEACAATLKRAGATTVYAAVVAWQPQKK